MTRNLVRPRALGSRWQLFDFDGSNSPFAPLTTTSVVTGRQWTVVCDTHTGPDSMAPVRDFLDESLQGRRLAVFNSHSDWDHVWGNCAFPDAVLMAHERCREDLESEELWSWSLASFGDARNGKPLRHPPDLTFTNRLTLADEGLTFFSSPGHTASCASLLDDEDGVLFVGDNLERPLPYLLWHRLDTYRATLQTYLELSPEVILTSHSGIVDVPLIEATLLYLERFERGEAPDLEDPEALRIHASNRVSVVVSTWEERARARLGEEFSLAGFLEAATGGQEDSLEEVARRLEKWFDEQVV